ncbi:hypothetical protein ACO3VM_04575 [Methanocaldococcus sp. 10A]
MYFSQNAIILVLLMFVTSAIYYATLQYETKAVEDEIKIKKFSLYEKNLINTLKRNIDKIVNDAFINASYKIMSEKKFFNNSEEAKEYIKSYIKNEINKTLSCLLNDSSLSITQINVTNITNTTNPLVINISMEIDLTYTKKLNNVILEATKTISINKNIKLSRIPDPYVYVNNNESQYYNGTYPIFNLFANITNTTT